MFFAKLRNAVRVMFPGSVPEHLSRLIGRLESECQPRSKAARIVTSTRLAALGTKLMEGAIGVEEEKTDPVGYRDGLMICTPRPKTGTPPDLLIPASGDSQMW
jgi:hypothetical protein